MSIADVVVVDLLFFSLSYSSSSFNVIESFHPLFLILYLQKIRHPSCIHDLNSVTTLFIVGGSHTPNNGQHI
jgi:hypothetical protein